MNHCLRVPLGQWQLTREVTTNNYCLSVSESLVTIPEKWRLTITVCLYPYESFTTTLDKWSLTLAVCLSTCRLPCQPLRDWVSGSVVSYSLSIVHHLKLSVFVSVSASFATVSDEWKALSTGPSTVSYSCHPT